MAEQLQPYHENGFPPKSSPASGRRSFTYPDPKPPTEPVLGAPSLEQGSKALRHVQREARETSHKCAVEANELQIFSDIGLDQPDQLIYVPSVDLIGHEWGSSPLCSRTKLPVPRPQNQAICLSSCRRYWN